MPVLRDSQLIEFECDIGPVPVFGECLYPPRPLAIRHEDDAPSQVRFSGLKKNSLAGTVEAVVLVGKRRSVTIGELDDNSVFSPDHVPELVSTGGHRDGKDTDEQCC